MQFGPPTVRRGATALNALYAAVPTRRRYLVSIIGTPAEPPTEGRRLHVLRAGRSDQPTRSVSLAVRWSNTARCPPVWRVLAGLRKRRLTPTRNWVGTVAPVRAGFPLSGLWIN